MHKKKFFCLLYNLIILSIIFSVLFILNMENLRLNSISDYQTYERHFCASKSNLATKKDAFEKSNPVSFKSRHVMDVNLKRRTTKSPIKGQIRELEGSYQDDRLMYSLGSMWAKTLYMGTILKNYYKGENNRFYIVSKGNSEDVKASDVKSILFFKDVIKGGKKQCSVEFLQAAPEIADNEKSSIKGSGELALYAAVNHAKESGCKQVTLTSTNNDFYENVGFEMGVKKDYRKAGTPY